MYQLTNNVSDNDNYLWGDPHLHLMFFVILMIQGESFSDHYFVTKFVAVNKHCIS